MRVQISKITRKLELNHFNSINVENMDGSELSRFLKIQRNMTNLRTVSSKFNV